MKLKLKLITIAAAMASLSGLAHADLTSGTSVGNGSVSLMAVDITTNNWYMRDLGVLMNDFLPSSVTTQAGDGGVTGNKTPAAGLTITSGPTLTATTNPNFADASFSTWLAAQTAGNVRWVISAYDLVGTVATNVNRLLISSANPTETITNAQVVSIASTGNAGGLFNFFNPGTLSRTGTVAPVTFLNAWGLGTDAMTAIGSSASLYYATRITGAVSTTQAAITKFGNSPTNFATVSLASNGEFTYNLAPAEVAAVPVPAAAWLLGAGLMALGGAVRRRKAAAQLA